MAVLTGELSIFRAAAEHPERVGLVASGTPFTFAALAERAARVAAWLDEHGSPPRIALVPRLDVATISFLHACMARGTTVVLVHPRLTASERSEIVRDAGAAIFVDDATAALREAERAAPAAGAPEPGVDPETILAVVYTSGTTGRSKGALLSRRAFLASARASATNLGWRDDDRWLLAMPLAHVGGLSVVVRALVARRTIVMIAEGERLDVELMNRVVSRDRVTIASLVPTMLARAFTEGAPSFPSYVRAVLLGGAASPKDLLDEARSRRIPTLTTYGLTEACSQVTTQRYGTAPRSEEGAGHPIEGTEIRIVDEQVEVRGPTLMSGYHGIASPPFVDGGWLRTEDFGRIDEEGRLHLLGRRQELIVTGGENVYPLEVERLLDAMADVRASCVFGTPDPVWGEIVCVAIVPASEPFSLERFARAVARDVASHKRPRRVAIVSELAVTAAGKLDRAATARAAAPQLAPLRGIT